MILSRQCKEYGTKRVSKKARELVSAVVEAREASMKEELDGNRQKIRGAAKKVKLGAQVEVNMHAMGTSFVNNVKDAQWMIGEWSGEERPEDIVEFQAQVTGYGAGAHAVFEKLLEMSDGKLVDRLERCNSILLVPAFWWSQCDQPVVPELESAGQWQKPAAAMQCVECAKR